jgi:hypothetical protein
VVQSCAAWVERYRPQVCAAVAAAAGISADSIVWRPATEILKEEVGGVGGWACACVWGGRGGGACCWRDGCCCRYLPPPAAAAASAARGVFERAEGVCACGAHT